MNTHDIELPEPKYPGTKADIPNAIPDLYTEDQVRAAIEADRQSRGLTDERIRIIWKETRARMGVGGDPVLWFARAIERAHGISAPQPLSESDIPAKPVKQKRQYAQGTALGEFGIIPMCDQVDDEPDEERLAMEAVMESVDPATWPGLTLAQRCALGRFAKPQPAEPQECGCCGRSDGCDPDCDVVQPAEPLKVPSDDVLADALTNLEHDNYEKSYSGYKNRQADVDLIRAALAAMGSGNPSVEIQAVYVDQTKSSRRERLMSDPKKAEALKRAKKRIEEHPVVKQYRVDTKHQNSE